MAGGEGTCPEGRGERSEECERSNEVYQGIDENIIG